MAWQAIAAAIKAALKEAAKEAAKKGGMAAAKEGVKAVAKEGVKGAAKKAVQGAVKGGVKGTAKRVATKAVAQAKNQVSARIGSKAGSVLFGGGEKSDGGETPNRSFAKKTWAIAKDVAKTRTPALNTLERIKRQFNPQFKAGGSSRLGRLLSVDRRLESIGGAVGVRTPEVVREESVLKNQSFQDFKRSEYLKNLPGEMANLALERERSAELHNIRKANAKSRRRSEGIGVIDNTAKTRTFSVLNSLFDKDKDVPGIQTDLTVEEQETFNDLPSVRKLNNVYAVMEMRTPTDGQSPEPWKIEESDRRMRAMGADPALLDTPDGVQQLAKTHLEPLMPAVYNEAKQYMIELAAKRNTKGAAVGKAAEQVRLARGETQAVFASYKGKSARGRLLIEAGSLLQSVDNDPQLLEDKGFITAAEEMTGQLGVELRRWPNQQGWGALEARPTPMAGVPQPPWQPARPFLASMIEGNPEVRSFRRSVASEVELGHAKTEAKRAETAQRAEEKRQKELETRELTGEEEAIFVDISQAMIAQRKEGGDTDAKLSHDEARALKRLIKEGKGPEEILEYLNYQRRGVGKGAPPGADAAFKGIYSKAVGLPPKSQ